MATVTAPTSPEFATGFARLRKAGTFSRRLSFAVDRSASRPHHQAALALTDTDNMFGALEFSEKLAGYGIQPIVGCAVAIDFGDETRDPRQTGRIRALPRIVLLAAREEGYRCLMRLNSLAFLQ